MITAFVIAILAICAVAAWMAWLDNRQEDVRYYSFDGVEAFDQDFIEVIVMLKTNDIITAEQARRYLHI